VGSYNSNSAGCTLCLGVRLTIEECRIAEDCDDGNPCTTDTCGAGTCEYSNKSYGTVCGDDGNECTVDICNGSGACIQSNAPNGTLCGDPSNTDCTNPDTCSSGVCVANNVSYGNACAGDGNECTNDICNGIGACTHPYKPYGSACGDPSNTDCTDPDICNGAGACLSKNASYGSSCTDDGNECTYDQCNSTGSCTHPNKPSGSSCGDSSASDCSNSDTCDGSGQCDENNLPSGTPCPNDAFCDGSETCDGTGDCQSGEPPCEANETCNEMADTCDIITDWYVGPGASIQAAIDAAFGSGGGTVHVAAGTYHENIQLRNTVKVLGAGAGDNPLVHTIIDGGGIDSVVMASGVDSTATLDGFLIVNGSASEGGGLHLNGSSPVISNCQISGNGATYGGGMHNEDASPTVVNCIFSNNTADNGAGMYNEGSSNPIVVNCTFTGNSAVLSGGGINSLSTCVIRNCVIWGNTPDGISGTADVAYCDVQGGFTGTGNKDVDPMLVDAENGDFHLEMGSPCIDSGDNGALPTGISTDFEGQIRILDGDGNGTAIVDMGADEALLSTAWLSGYVYSGALGDETTPLSDVGVQLYCSDNAGDLGILVTTTTTNAHGWYWLPIPEVCNYYNLLETDSTDYTSTGAVTVGGAVINKNRIQYSHPLTGKILTDNNFWDIFDSTPPQIISGPTLSLITQSSVRISWETDEDSVSTVRYGRDAQLNDSEEVETTFTKNISSGIPRREGHAVLDDTNAPVGA